MTGTWNIEFYSEYILAVVWNSSVDPYVESLSLKYHKKYSNNHEIPLIMITKEHFNYSISHEVPNQSD